MEQKLKNNSIKQKIMRKTTKQLFFAALALTTLGSCTDETFTGDQSLKGGTGAISFSMNTPAMTRADKTGADAAADLSSQFIVYAEKDENADGTAAAAGKLVFQNYKVAYTANTAYTTTSNTKDWEYVGQAWTDEEHGNITTSTTDAQTIKYWDWGAANYTFTAVSALPTDISSGKVKITKTTAETGGNKVYDKGYSVVLADDADLDKLFFSERKVIASSNNTDRTQSNTYGGNVTLRFHNAASKVRVAMYETVPGHSVTINKFTVDSDGDDPGFSDMVNDVTTNFAANFQNCAEGTTGTLTVKYHNTGTLENHPTVSFSGTAADVLALGDNLKATVTIGESASGATYDKDSKAYTTVFPKEDNIQNLKLKVSYTLKAPITNETITVTDATAEIPAAYLKWKPGYAYTYIFKISDNTNGQTGTGSTPAGLYPITFDAVEMVDADGEAEYITTISEPSITTFGVKDSKYVTGGSDYVDGTTVYATVMDESVLATLSSSNMNLYTVTGAGVISEAGVAEAIIEKPTMTKAQVDAAKVVPAASSFTGYVNTVPGEDGIDKELDASDDKAAYFTTATGTTYALVYQKEGEGPTYVCGTAVVCTVDDFAEKRTAAGGHLYQEDTCENEQADAAAGTFYAPNGNTYTSEQFTAAGMLYKNAACTELADADYYSSHTDATYFKPIKVKDKGVVVVKVVTCPAP